MDRKGQKTIPIAKAGGKTPVPDRKSQSASGPPTRRPRDLAVVEERRPARSDVLGLSGPDRLLTEAEASGLLRVSRKSLQLWRHERRGPDYIDIGEKKRRCIRYRLHALVEWAKRKEIRPGRTS